jgi:Protein of unknown function (DUF3800)
MVLQAFCDESGSDERAKFLAIGGLVAEREKWVSFSRDWIDVLHEFAVNSPFKTQHFEKRKKQFSGWSNEKRHFLLNGLLLAITKNVQGVIGSAVSLEGYRKLITGKVKAQVGSPYCLCFSGCVWCGAKWSRDFLYREPVNYLFDVGHKNSEEAGMLWRKEYAKDSTRRNYRLGTFSLDSDRRCVPLQAADLVAYWLRRYLQHKEKDPEAEIPYPLRVIFKSVQYRTRLFDCEALSQIRRDSISGKIKRTDKTQDAATRL